MNRPYAVRPSGGSRLRHQTTRTGSALSARTNLMPDAASLPPSQLGKSYTTAPRPSRRLTTVTKKKDAEAEDFEE